MRAYLPLTTEALRAAAASGMFPAQGAVLASDETEEAEYAALVEAAARSRELLGGAGRRVVAVFEGRPDPGWSLGQAQALHADTEDIAADDEDPPELAWFAVQELELLLV